MSFHSFTHMDTPKHFDQYGCITFEITPHVTIGPGLLYPRLCCGRADSRVERKAVTHCTSFSGVVMFEYLCNIGKVRSKRPFFIGLPIKIEDSDDALARIIVFGSEQPAPI